MSEPIAKRTKAEAAVLRVSVLRLCLKRKPVREIAEALGISPDYVGKLRNEMLAEVRGLETMKARELLQLEIEVCRQDLEILTARQVDNPAHGYGLYQAKLDVQERMLRLQGIDVGKVGAVVQVNVNAPGAALAMQATPSEDLLRLLSEVDMPAEGEEAIEAGEGPEPGEDSGPVDV